MRKELKRQLARDGPSRDGGGVAGTVLLLGVVDEAQPVEDREGHDRREPGGDGQQRKGSSSSSEGGWKEGSVGDACYECGTSETTSPLKKLDNNRHSHRERTQK